MTFPAKVYHGTQDANLVLKAAGLIAASAAVATIVDLGPGEFFGLIELNVTALEIATNDEAYTIVLQGSPDAAFGTAGNIVELQAFHLGAKETKLTDSDKDDAVGQFVKPFCNLDINGSPLRYVRLYTVVAGTIATGINYTAAITK